LFGQGEEAGEGGESRAVRARSRSSGACGTGARRVRSAGGRTGASSSGSGRGGGESPGAGLIHLVDGTDSGSVGSMAGVYASYLNDVS
jgi:hypothetical protein